MKLLLSSLVVGLFLMGCTDASRKNMFTLGSEATVKCYSGGINVYTGRSTGKVLSEERGVGWLFEDAATHKLVRVSGTCVIEN